MQPHSDLAARAVSRKGPLRANPVRVERPPATEAERKQLRAACKAAARRMGKSGQSLRVETERLYQDAIAEASHQVREPAVHRMVMTKKDPDGHARTPAGLIVPVPK